VRKKRPINLYLPSISFPIPAIVSILHRLSGVLLFVCIPFLLWAFHLSLATPEGFHQAEHFFTIFWVKGIIWFSLVGLMGHTIAGIRHLLMDIGIGESRMAGRISAWIVVGLSVVLAVFAGIWLW